MKGGANPLNVREGTRRETADKTQQGETGQHNTMNGNGNGKGNGERLGGWDGAGDGCNIQRLWLIGKEIRTDQDDQLCLFPPRERIRIHYYE